MDSLLQRFASRLAGLGLGPAHTVVAALSGGADSSALLGLLCALPESRRPRVFALHVQHRLRGRDSAADERAVRALCKGLGVVLDVAAAPVSAGTAVEERARDARHRAYARACRKRGAALLLLAHHRRDRVETLLMNLARGAGLKGAGALRARSPLPGHPQVTQLRPLLGESPDLLRAWLRARGLAWREDRSNQDRRFARNRVRLSVLPQLEAAWPGAEERLAAFAGKAEEASRWLEEQAARALALRRRDGGLDLRAFGRDPWLDGQILRAWLSEAGLPAEDRLLHRVEALMLKGRGQCDLRKGLAARIRAGRLEMARLLR